MYPGDQYCDLHGIDIYTDAFWPIDSPDGTNFGPTRATPTNRRLREGGLEVHLVPLDSWWSSYDTLSHWYDFSDGSNGNPDGQPATGADPTGANSNWGWGMSKAVDFALASGVFAGAIDPVSGQPRVKKPLCIPECGPINLADFGCGAGGGRGPFDNGSQPQPAFMAALAALTI